MGLDTYTDVWRGVLLRCPVAGPLLAQQWVTYAFRRLGERRQWSWLTREGQFLLNTVYNAGTVTVTRGSLIVTGVATAFTGAMVGRQFRPTTVVPIYTVASVQSTTQLTLDKAFGGDTAAGTGYMIFNAYLTVPPDFHSFISVIDPRMNWQLWLNVQPEELNAWDAQRSNVGTPWAVVSHDYNTAVTPPLPRYEIWPYQMSQYVYPFLYEARPIDLGDSGASLPRYIRGDVLLEMALAECAAWPGPSTEQPNPYFNLQLATYHAARSEKMIFECERQDDEVFERDLKYATWGNLPFAPFPLGDSRFLQSHAF